MYKWKILSNSVSIKRDPIMEAYRPYGIYILNGIKRIRNYKRTLKNGKGMNFTELLQWRIEAAKREMAKILYQGVMNV